MPGMKWMFNEFYFVVTVIITIIVILGRLKILEQLVAGLGYSYIQEKYFFWGQ